MDTKKLGDGIGETAARVLWQVYGDEIRALPSEQRDQVRQAMVDAIERSVTMALLLTDTKDRSRINALVTHASEQLAAMAIARAGHTKLRELQAANAQAAALDVIKRAAA